MLWYPRLQTAAESGEAAEAMEGELQQLALHSKYVALPIEDTMDREMVVSYRYYIPAKAAAEW